MARRGKSSKKLISALIEGAIGAGAGYFGAMGADKLASHFLTKTKVDEKSGQAARNAYAKERGIKPAVVAGGLAAVGGGAVIHAGYPVLGASFMAGAAGYAASDLRSTLRVLKVAEATPTNPATPVPTNTNTVNSVSSNVALAGEQQAAVVEDDQGNRYRLLSGDENASLVDERGNVRAVNTPEATTFAIDRTTGQVVLLGFDEIAEVDGKDEEPEMLGEESGNEVGEDFEFDGDEDDAFSL